MGWIVEGGRALIGDEVRPASLHVNGALVSDVPPRGAQNFDAADFLVLPGIVDIHGDGFERQVLPRPNVTFPLDVALVDTDQQMISNGITTAFHGLSISWEPGLRSIAAAHAFVEAFTRLRPQLACDTRLHLRWETFALDAVDEVLAWVALDPPPILAFNDHTTSTIHKAPSSKKIGTWASRCGLTTDAYLALLHRVWERRTAVPEAIFRVARKAREVGAVVLAHDETSPEMRAEYRALGAVTSEFPMNEATASAARRAGEHTIFGAPNVVRGGSHNGALRAADMVSRGLCSVLTSDYYYPAPLLAAFRLVEEDILPLPAAWALVSRNAAEAAGLTDRGDLTPGQRADFIVVDDADPGLPRVVASFVGGRKVFDRS